MASSTALVVYADQEITNPRFDKRPDKNEIRELFRGFRGENLKEYGAKGDGVTNDTTAILAWLARLGNGVWGFIPAGTYLFDQALVAPVAAGVQICGEGGSNSILKYFGASTTVNLFTHGDGTVSIAGAEFRDFQIDSATTMTSGTAFRALKWQNGGMIRNLNIGAGSGPRTVFDGIEFNNTNLVTYDIGTVWCKGTGVRAVGDAASDTASDLWLTRVKVPGTPYSGPGSGTNYGFHVAGGFGGIYFSDTFAYGCNYNYVVDRARAARGNRELFWDKKCVADAANQYNFWVNDNLSSAMILSIGCFIAGAGFLAGAVTGRHGIVIDSAPNANILITCSHIHRNKGAGIYIVDTTANVWVSDGTNIIYNDRYGIESTTALPLLVDHSYNSGNTLGQYAANVSPGPALVQSSAAVTAGTGTITTVTATKAVSRTGKLVTLRGNINVSANGTGGNSLVFATGFTALGKDVGHGYSTTLNKGLTVRTNAGGTALSITAEGGVYPGPGLHDFTITFEVA